jgi:hypothetical protein
MGKKQPDYISYLLRIWQSNGNETAWRASLQDPHTGERLGFASIDDLCIFLRRQAGVMSNRGGTKKGSEQKPKDKEGLK